MSRITAADIAEAGLVAATAAATLAALFGLLFAAGILLGAI